MIDEPLPLTKPARRWIVVTSFIAAWMGCGWLLRLDTNAYLVLGVPLTVLFQLFVRRRPIQALWVQQAPLFRLGWKGFAIAGGLSIMPLAELVGSVAEGEWFGCLYCVCAGVGAIGAAYAIRNFRRENVRPLLGCLLITLTLDAIQWSVFLGFKLVELRPAEGGILGRLAVGIASMLEYTAVTFVIEEVTFRMLDSHLHEADRRRGILSAVFISAAWGLWHLPILGEFNWETIGVLLYVHVPYGVCLSLFWRKTGNLLVPGLCHALGDAIRNAITMPG